MTGAAVVPLDELRRIRGLAEKGQQSDAVVLTKKEYDRMKQFSKIITPEEERERQKLNNEQKQVRMAAAQARKKRMQLRDNERASKLPPTEYQKESKKKKEGLLQNAQDALDEEKDDVKHMNQMCLYSKCVTIRDKQLEEQKRLEAEYRDEERRLDLMMEIERLKNLKHQEELEEKRKAARKQGAFVIIDQIKERELERIKEQEVREKEKQLIVEQINALKEEEKKQIIEKKEIAHKLMLEVEEANRSAISGKEKKKEEERQLEAEIVEYNRLKAQREEEIELDKKKAQEEKEKEVQRLRDLQEKVSDRQAEIDALRAKRAFEESERAAREKEKKEREHKLKVQREMEAARQSQFSEKERRMAEIAKQERDEYLRIIQTQKEEEMKDTEIDNEKKNILRDHANQIRSQITQNEEVKKQERLDYLEEGRKIRKQLDDEKERLLRIKEKKLNDLAHLGIPDKYKTELSKKKIT